MKSKNIGPILQRLFQRSAVVIVVTTVGVGVVSAKNVFKSAVQSKLSNIEQLKHDKDTLGRERNNIQKAKDEAQSKFDRSKAELAKELDSLKLKVETGKKELAKIRQSVSEEIESAQAEFEKTQKLIEDAVDSLKQEMDRARSAAKKAEQICDEGSYWIAWVSKWGKSWEDYQRQKARDKEARDEAKRKARESLEEATKRYMQLKDAASNSLEDAKKKFERKKEIEESALRLKEEDANKIEESERKKVVELEQQTTALKKIIEGIEEQKQAVECRLGNIEKTLAAVPWWQQFESEVWSVLRRHLWTILGAAFVFVTPVGIWIRRLAVWFGPGTWVERRRKPLAFPEWHTTPGPITTTSNRVSIEVQVKAGEVAWFRDDYLDRTTRPKGTKFGLLPIFSKRFWLMSLIDGLWWMTVIKGDSENRTNFKVSDADSTATEFAVVEIPVNSSLIIRPHFIVGLTFPDDCPPKLKRHWRLTQLEAWCVMQLWFFELSGPARVVLRGARGVQSHSSVEDDSIETRLNPGSLIGFSPTAKLYICRSESLWQYIANEEPFYNYAFEGNGTFLTHETQETSHRSGPLSWLAGIGELLLKLAGF